MKAPDSSNNKRASIGLLISIDARYSNIYDYESTTFLGKQTNGKQARSTLMTIEIIGA